MPPRVAFFADCFHEINGVALTSRKFAEFACETARPFLTVRAGSEKRITKSGSCTDLELTPSPLSFGIDRDLAFDLLFARHLGKVRRVTQAFSADLIHVTCPGHFGLLGAIVAHQLGIPLVASWHTNIHEFAARRLNQSIPWLPEGARAAASRWTEESILAMTLQFYRQARLLFAPNRELVELLQANTALPCYLMARGIDVVTFAPRHRTRSGGGFVIGFVGRLSAEKNVRLLAELDARLRAEGIDSHRFLIVGDGSERGWLRAHLPGAELPGVLRGQALAEAYANMDVFVFPSETDTFGNVIQEALASGVPCVVSAHGGPKYLVRERETGFVAQTPADYASAVAALYRAPDLLTRMKAQARRSAEGRDWHSVFEGVYARYVEHLSPQTKPADIVSPNLHQKYNAR